MMSMDPADALFKHADNFSMKINNLIVNIYLDLLMTEYNSWIVQKAV